MATIAENVAAKKARESGATASTELVLGAGARSLAAATSQFTSAFAAIQASGQSILDKLNEQAGTLTLLIQNGEERVAQLKAEAKEEKRRNEVEVELAYQADEAAAATKWATANKKTIIDTQVYQAELNGYAKLKDEFATQVAAEVGKARGMADQQAKADKALAEAQFNAKEAENKARLTVLEQQLADARAETQRAWDALAAERQAGVERAKAQGSSTVNVGSPNQR